MMITAFGKILRKYRIDSEMLLKEMADKLEVSSAYLSAIENGKREIPRNLPKKISEKFDISKDELEKAAFISSKFAEIKLSEKYEEANDLLFALARDFDSLDESTIAKMKQILDSK